MAFGASNSRNSINKQFAQFAAGQIENIKVDLLDLNDFEMPIYSIDIEKDSGFPEAAKRFKEHISASDAIIISFAEHNGHYTVAFKNIFDWVTRMDRNMWMNKPMFLLSTAPGPRGAHRVIESAEIDMARKAGNVVSIFSLPSHWENFSKDTGITNEELKKKFEIELLKFKEALLSKASAL
jgi:NAD(P)H-dependent FMN reductase